jgi:hypothetical protein
LRELVRKGIDNAIKSSYNDDMKEDDMETNIKPYSLRLPSEMRGPLTAWAAADHRKLHSLILKLLDDALQAHRAGEPESVNAASAFHQQPMRQVLSASVVEDAG